MSRFVGKRCRWCEFYAPSIEYKNNHYCKIGLCNRGKMNYSKIIWTTKMTEVNK